MVRNSLLDPSPDKDLLSEQLDRMETTVTHQLTKASASGPVVVGKTVDLTEVVQRLLRALQTAYVERGIVVTTQLTAPVVAKGDDRDFLEILGNLLENAFKYTNTRVNVEAQMVQRDGVAFASVCIEDDGAGIAPSLRKEVLSRGRRLDEIENGQGIGLAVVAELVNLYAGELSIADSAMGGAAITLRLR